MAGRKRVGVPADLVRARSRFAAWRRTRKAGTRIPEPLWDAAAKLVEVHGLHRTASTLGLDYYALKKRVRSALPEQQPNGNAAAAFIELGPTLSTSSECVIELDNGSGATMRIHLRGRDGLDLLALTRTFWSGQ